MKNASRSKLPLTWWSCLVQPSCSVQPRYCGFLCCFLSIILLTSFWSLRLFCVWIRRTPTFSKIRTRTLSENFGLRVDIGWVVCEGGTVIWTHSVVCICDFKFVFWMQSRGGTVKDWSTKTTKEKEKILKGSAQQKKYWRKNTERQCPAPKNFSPEHESFDRKHK